MSKRKKTGGRTAGTPNKVTADTRDYLKTFLDGNRKEFEKAFKRLNPKEKVKAWTRILPFCTPAFSSVSLDFNTWTPEQLLAFENHLKQKYQNAEQAGDYTED